MTGFSTAQFLPCDTLYCMSYVGQLLEENITKERFSSGRKKIQEEVTEYLLCFNSLVEFHSASTQ